MPAEDTRLSLLTFPQRIDPAPPGPAAGSRLALRLFAAPTRNPLDAMGPGLPAFADLPLRLDLRAVASLEDLPGPAAGTVLATLDLGPHPDARAVLEALAGRIPIDPSPPPADPGLSRLRFLKVAPPSFLAAAGAALRGSSHLVTPETYACAMRDALDPALRPPPKPMPDALSWNQVLSRAMRQPLLARAIGLVHEAAVDLPQDGFFAEGGFVWFEPAAGTALAGAAAGPDFLRLYAARLPRLPAGSERPLFAAVLFPVRPGPPPAGAGYDDIFAEASAYDDGFAKIVHAHQPERHDEFDVAQAGPDRLLPVQDAGIRLGWDDGQVVEWLNRQAAEDPRNPAPALPSRDAPLGVLGYRVDVREAADGAGEAPWSSLVRAEGALALDGIDLGNFAGELAVEPLPSLQQRVAMAGGTRDQYWLPPYAVRWPGGSLLAGDAVARAFAGRDPSRRWFKPEGEDAVPLLYGREYEFRVRLMDMAGGGPKPSDPSLNGAFHGTGRIRFRRHAPPKDLRWNEFQSIEGERRTVMYLFRPLIGHPDALYVEHGFDPRPALLADLPAAQASRREPGLPDPDVTLMRIDIEVGTLEGDPANGRSAPSPRQPLFTVPLVRSFPADPEGPVELDFRFVDAPTLDRLPPPAAEGPIVLPGSRDIFVTLRPIARPDPAMTRTGSADPVLVGDPARPELARRDASLDYYGSQAARVGMAAGFRLREPSVDETALLAGTSQPPLQAILLAPDPLPTSLMGAVQAGAGGPYGASTGDALGRLGFQLGLSHDGLAFSPLPGRRRVVACSPRLAHLAAPDRGTVTFGSRGDLVDRWLVAVQLRLLRDWSWDGLAEEGFAVWRSLDGGPEEPAGRIPVPRALAAGMGQGVGAGEGGEPDRSFTDLLFIDLVDPLPETGIPAERRVSYRVAPQFRDPQPTSLPEPWTGALRLPVARPPVQRPEIVSAGLASSPHISDPAYTATEPRRRMVWIEFASEPANPIDLPYGRVLTWAPDPVLTGQPPSPAGTADPPLSLPDEFIRTILPDQSDDQAGLDAMQPLIPTDHPRRFLLPLPPGTTRSSPRLFGFHRYEFRIGHGPAAWSTARARFGPPLGINGIRHPPPELDCRAVRLPDRLLVTAPFARSDGPDFPAGTPRVTGTHIWFLLYAQAARADGAANRNILIARRRGHLADLPVMPIAVQRAQAVWALKEIEERAGVLGLALQLRSAPEVSISGHSLMAAAPGGPCDDGRGFDPALG
jgi:hypothetical protein